MNVYKDVVFPFPIWIIIIWIIFPVWIHVSLLRLLLSSLFRLSGLYSFICLINYCCKQISTSPLPYTTITNIFIIYRNIDSGILFVQLLIVKAK